MRIAVFGGSFNPPHIGHAMVIQWLLWSGKADRILVVPSEGHPLKKNPPAHADVRETLLLCMVSDLNLGGRVVVHRAERNLPKPVYTYNLMQHLKEENRGHELLFVVGADIIEEAHKWYRWDDLTEEFPPVVLGRTGYETITDNPTMPSYSSSEIRKFMTEGDARWEEMVTPSVRALLKRNLPDYPLG